MSGDAGPWSEEVLVFRPSLVKCAASHRTLGASFLAVRSAPPHKVGEQGKPLMLAEYSQRNMRVLAFFEAE